MIVWLARGLTRLVALILLPVLALVALAAGASAVAGGARSRDAAEALGVSDAFRVLGDALRGAPIDEQSVLLGGVIAVVAGAILLVGVLVPRKERDLSLSGHDGLGVRRRALRQAVRHLTESVRGVRDARVRVGARRLRSGGRVRVRAARAARTDQAAVTSVINERVGPLARAFGLESRVRSGVADDRKGALR